MITSRQVREKYLRFFEKQGHKVIPAAPLVLKDDPSTLFTSAGMQPLVPYLKGQTHPEGKRLVNSQPCFRSQDIDEVGDNRHTTFFEMLGNWSLGEYFKEEQLKYFWEFLTNKQDGLGLNPEKLYISVFGGEEEDFKVYSNGKYQPLNPDVESVNIWQRLLENSGVDSRVANIATKDKPDIRNGKIFYYEAKKNWWSLSGTPLEMSIGDIGGPDSEVFYDFGEEGLHEKYIADNSNTVTPCHPNCDCGRFLEIGNSVFIQYRKIDERTLEELSQKNVDFGGGLERLVAAVNNDPDIFKIDTFGTVISTIETETGRNYKDSVKYLRRIADHTKAAVFIIAAGIEPSNVSHGYVLRRLIRRVLRFLYKLETDTKSITKIAQEVISVYADTYPELKNKSEIISKTLIGEGEKFKEPINDLELYRQDLEAAIRDKVIKKIGSVPIIYENGNASGRYVFENYQSYGVPPDLAEDVTEELGVPFNKEEFLKAMSEHQDKSRTAGAGMFKGGLAGDTPTMRRYHTTAHLLQAALRKVLGEHVEQAGQNITDERLRFDFKHTGQVTDADKIKTEKLVNEMIDKALPVYSKVMDLEEAYKEGALGFFKDRYGKEVSVYTIGGSSTSSGQFSGKNWVSKEICGGPHVENTSEIGRVTITREESAGAGVRRIYATLDISNRK